MFCRTHNRLSAERVYGREFMDRKIAARQAGPEAALEAESGEKEEMHLGPGHPPEIDLASTRT